MNDQKGKRFEECHNSDFFELAEKEVGTSNQKRDFDISLQCSFKREMAVLFGFPLAYCDRRETLYFDESGNRHSVNAKAFRPSYVVAKPSGDLWYDALIRVADYFCGTFSRIDSEDDKMDRALNKLLCKYVIGNPCSVLNVTEKSVTRSVFSVK